MSWHHIFNFPLNLLITCYFGTVDLTVRVWSWHARKKDRKKPRSWHRADSVGRQWRTVKCWLKSVEKSIKWGSLIDRLPRCFLWRCQEQHNCSPPSSLSLSSPPPLPALPSVLSITCLFTHHHTVVFSLSVTRLPQYLSRFSLHCSSSSTVSHTTSHFLS